MGRDDNDKKNPWGRPGNDDRGPWGSKGGSSGGSGGEPPDIDDMLRKAQDNFRSVMPNGFQGAPMIGLIIVGIPFLDHVFHFPGSLLPGFAQVFNAAAPISQGH